MLAYADTSALVKLIRVETDAPALVDFVADLDALITSRVAYVELGRVALRNGIHQDAAKELTDRLVFRELTLDIAASAARLEPPELRSLDAIHLATALELLPQLDAFLTYDKRLADAAREYGLTVAAPV